MSVSSSRSWTELPSKGSAMVKWKLAVFAAALMAPMLALGQTSSQSQPTEESKKLPTGSAAERKARMKVRANSPAYTNKFDLSGLPSYVRQEKPTGALRICGKNYVGCSPLGGWWKQAFEKAQPGITTAYNLPSAAI